MIEIPLTVPPPPRATFSIELAGVTVALEIRWNSATSGWYLDVRDAAGAPVRLGARLTVGRPIGWRSLDPRFPTGGWLVVIDTTGAEADPGFDDLGTRHRLLFVDRSDVPRVPIAVQRRLNPRAFVPTDGPDDVFVPQIAAHWEALGIPVPTIQVSTQVSSGDLTALIGASDMTTSGTGQQYGHSVTGWDLNAVRKPGGVTGHWEIATALDLGATDDFAMLAYNAWDVGGATENLWEFWNSNYAWRVSTSSRFFILWDGSQFQLSDQEPLIDALVPLYVVKDVSADLAFYATAEEEGSRSDSSDAITGAVQTSPDSAIDAAFGPLVAFWKGADATALIDAGFTDGSILEALGWELPY